MIIRLLSISFLITVHTVPLFSNFSHAAIPKMSDRLTVVRTQILFLEENLIESLKTQKQAKNTLRQIQTLMKLQEEERSLGLQRYNELEKTILTLEERRGELQQKIIAEEKSIRKALQVIERSFQEPPQSSHSFSPLRKALSLRVNHSLNEVATLKADFQDAEALEKKIQEEKLHLTYLLQDLREQESILELNRQLQLDVLQKKHQERIAQLESYRALKKSEAAIEHMIHKFSISKEVETLGANEAALSQIKGQLPMPVSGQIISNFGRVLDPKSKLFIFKKGIEIVPKNLTEPVRSILPGTVVFSGELPRYEKITIVDHGNHLYSLCAHLGTIYKKLGDKVLAGETLGLANNAGSPVYFEIRMRNIAVNPLQWISN